MNQMPDATTLTPARPARARETLRIAIVGAGFGGIGLAIHLLRQGYRAITIFERAHAIGGTWRDNTYPGAACDVQSHLYSYSFAPRTDWPERFSGQKEILSYIQSTAEKFGVTPHVRLNSPVTSACWDAATATWRVQTGSGAQEEFDIFIPAVGQLSRPTIPEFPGLNSFKGAAFHSAAWDHGQDLRGKRVALIGSAASAVQIAPELARICAHLDVFQRTPNWLVPRNNRLIGGARHRLFRHVPLYRLALRLYLYLYGEFLFDAFRTGSWRNGLLKSAAMKHLAAQVSDPVLRAKLTPKYELGCKRVLFSDDFYPIFDKPHASLVTEAITGFEPAGIRTADGVLHEADAAIFATGFDVRNSLHHIRITGRDGTDLQTHWSAGPQGYRGIGVPAFPNMFMLYGPNTNLGHTSIIIMLEAQSRYILNCLDHIVAANLSTLEVREDANRRYNETLQNSLAAMVWSTGCGNWYASGDKVTANWSGSTLAYRRMMRRVDFGDFVAA